MQEFVVTEPGVYEPSVQQDGTIKDKRVAVGTVYKFKDGEDIPARLVGKGHVLAKQPQPEPDEQPVEPAKEQTGDAAPKAPPKAPGK